MAEMLDAVGPVLRAEPAARAVIEAIRERNRDVSVLDRGSYWRVRAPGRCEVERAAVEKRLGTRFRFPGDLEAVMASFAGRFTIDEERACWEAPGGEKGATR